MKKQINMNIWMEVGYVAPVGLPKEITKKVAFTVKLLKIPKQKL